VTRFLDSLAATLTGLLLGVALVGAVAPGAWVVVPAQSAGQGDPATSGTGAAVAPRLLGERHAADDASSRHRSAVDDADVARGGGIVDRTLDDFTLGIGQRPRVVVVGTRRLTGTAEVGTLAPVGCEAASGVVAPAGALAGDIDPIEGCLIFGTLCDVAGLAAAVGGLAEPAHVAGSGPIGHAVSLVLRLSALSVTRLSSPGYPAASSAPESIPAVSRPDEGLVPLDDLARNGQPDRAKAVIPASTGLDSEPSPGRITTPSAETSALSGAPMGKRPAATGVPRTAVTLRGTATWFRSPAGVSAAGPALRAALPGWRGTSVRVCHADRCIVTVLGDFMRADRLIDLDDDAFAALAPLSVGVLAVVLTPIPAPPVTSRETP
jgi:hypothetical protein